MFSWLKKIKFKFKSSCCMDVEIKNTDSMSEPPPEYEKKNITAV